MVHSSYGVLLLGRSCGCEGGMWLIPVMVCCCLFVVMVVRVLCGSLQLWCVAACLNQGTINNG